MKRHLWVSTLMCCMAAGCVTSGSHRHECEDDDDDSVNINPLIGAIGMAVDGDDKDDYEHYFESKCDCGHCKKCR